MTSGRIQSQIPLTPVVKWLIIVTVSIWLVFQVIMEGYGGVAFSRYFALQPSRVLFEFHIWQFVTYIFLHSLSVGHVALNMLMLWFVGAELEQRWGRKFFLSYYLATGVGAAIIYCLGTYIYFLVTGDQHSLRVPVLGASGSIFGLLLAYGLIFGERTVHFMMIFPMKAKVFILLLSAVEVVSMLTSGVTGGEVANLAHIGGFLSGYIILRGWTFLQRFQWNRKTRNRNRNLRLVVDNDKKSKNENGPRYWN